MIKKSLFIMLMLVSLCLVGCKEKEYDEPTRLTAGEVKRQIVRGETTQVEVVTYFGNPNLVSINKDNNEVWAYNRMSYDKYSGSSGISLIFVGGAKSNSSSSTRSFDLIITFDKNEVVQDYKVIQAAY